VIITHSALVDQKGCRLYDGKTDGEKRSSGMDLLSAGPEAMEGTVDSSGYHETAEIKRYKACNIKHMTFFSSKVKKELIFKRQFDKDALFFPDMKNETAE
jgi:hypothetical protein